MNNSTRYSKIIILMLGLMCIVFNTSCSKWFDISPKTDVKAEDLYETEDGFMSALTGVYVSMTEHNAYGYNLSYGTLDQLAQLYDWLPNNVVDRASIYVYDRSTTGGYNTKTVLSQTWKKTYNIIANINNLLKWLDVKGADVIKNPQKLDMIRGEALALRAYIHFDILRGWGPIYKQHPDMKCIPYRIVADNSKQPILPASQIIELIVKDLQQARQLLTFEAENKLVGEYVEQRFRMNYHAVNALLARVYCYAGDSEHAISYAKEVIESSGLELQINNQEDPIQFRETLFGINLYKMDEAVKNQFSEDSEHLTSKFFCTQETLNALYEISGSITEDIRANSSGFIRFNDQQKVLSRKYIRNDEGVIPLIRLPEMYYILSEMSSLDTAASYLNKVRNKRGFPTSANVRINTEEERISAIDKEYRKEFYAEGQYFYFLKRHAIKNFVNCPIPEGLGESQYIFPRPDDEIEYGWTDAQDEEGSNNE